MQRCVVFIVFKLPRHMNKQKTSGKISTVEGSQGSLKISNNYVNSMYIKFLKLVVSFSQYNNNFPNTL